MEHVSRFGPLGSSRFWLGSAVLVATIFATSALTGHGRATESRVLAAGCIAAIGTLASAAIHVRAVGYARWAYWTAAVLMALGLLASALFTPSPRVWAEETNSIVWMVPWFFMMLAVTPAAAKGACAPGSPRSGWLLIGTGVLYTLILQLPALFHRS